MRPWKNGEQMAAERVIPRGTKARIDCAAWLQKIVHGFQNGAGIAEMLESVEGNDCIDALEGFSRKHADILHACALRILPGAAQRRFAIVDSNHLRSVVLRQLDRLMAVTTTEINHY